MLPVIAKQFEHVFPELQKQIDFVSKVVKEEEEAFLRTLEKGIIRFNEYIKWRENHPDASHKWSSEFNNDFEPSYTSVNNKGAFDESKLKRYKVEPRTITGEFAFELHDTYGFPLDLTELMSKEIGWNVDIAQFEEE